MTDQPETVRLWAQDYSEVLLTTEDREAAKTFFFASDYDWLPIVIDYGTNWSQRWSGRIERDGSIHQERDYLAHITQWPVPDLTSAHGVETPR